MTKRCVLVLSALVLSALGAVGCGGAAAPGTSPDAKPGGAGAETLEPAMVGLAIDSTAPARPPRPAYGRDLAARAYGASPIGALTSEHVDEYPVHVEIVSLADVPVAVEDATIHVLVERDARVMRGCDGGAPISIDAPRVLAPGESLVADATLPCPLSERGRYDVVAVIEIDPDRGAGARLVARMPLVVDGRRPFRGTSLAPADEAAEADPIDPPDRPNEVREQEPGLVAP